MIYSVLGLRASSTNSRDWSDFPRTLATWRRYPERYTGLGFVFSPEDPFVGIDLDDCLDVDGALKGWAQGIVERFSDTYMEISPSGQGLKIWTKGRLPASVAGVRLGNGQIEMYDRSRYFTVTGRAFREAPLEIEDHAADLLRLYERLVGRKSKRWPLQPLEGGRIPYGQQHKCTRGVWVIEIAELDSMSRTEVSKTKGFISRTTDRFRPPYGKRLVESSRQYVFAGSVNHSTYLRDETGGRRFWPVACTGTKAALCSRGPCTGSNTSRAGLSASRRRLGTGRPARTRRSGSRRRPNSSWAGRMKTNSTTQRRSRLN